MPPSEQITKDVIQRAVDEHLLEMGFTDNGDGYLLTGELTKERIRELSKPARLEGIEKSRTFIQRKGESLITHFANGNEIDPDSIQPELVEVESESEDSDLFRFATFLWSVPVSQGYGRRIRFLVKDKHTNRLIGLFALGDPVFNLSARDDFIGWSGEDRKKRLVQVMDAYVFGAVPPYSMLIGGKLVAALMGSIEVSRVFERKYFHHKSLISGIAKHARLVLITTTSALGRSSLLNRLRIPNGIQPIRIGTTRGFGHFHISDGLFELMRAYLAQKDHPYSKGNNFGDGSNWRMRVVRTVLEDIGIDGDGVLRHGIEREVYAIPLANNWKNLLLGMDSELNGCLLPAATISDFCLKRWIIPRSERDTRYESFNKSSIIHKLLNGGPPPSW